MDRSVDGEPFRADISLEQKQDEDKGKTRKWRLSGVRADGAGTGDRGPPWMRSCHILAPVACETSTTPQLEPLPSGSCHCGFALLLGQPGMVTSREDSAQGGWLCHSGPLANSPISAHLITHRGPDETSDWPSCPYLTGPQKGEGGNWTLLSERPCPGPLATVTELGNHGLSAAQHPGPDRCGQKPVCQAGGLRKGVGEESHYEKPNMFLA